VGVAPLAMLADEAVAKGLSVTLAMGAKTAGELYPGQLLPPEVEYVVATEDGTAGHRGFVTAALDEVYDWADQVFACGPLGMLTALKRVSRRRPSTPVQVSLEEHMGCAVGVCYGCVVSTRHGPRRVCADGPVFDLDEVVLE
jgi:dihydroorotate dehydrogenase electron transfer subunit